MTQDAVRAQNRVINRLCGLAASRALASLSSPSNLFLQHNPAASMHFRRFTCPEIASRK
jgi:hypothetical protein